MSTLASRLTHGVVHPVDVHVDTVLDDRDRLTGAFRLLLAIPHMLLVGGPMAIAFTLSWQAENGLTWEWGSSSGALGAVAFIGAIISWFAIVFTGSQPHGLWKLAAFYLRWRVRAVAYLTLLRDEYPPFGDAPFPARLELEEPDAPRDRLTVGLRPILVVPHLVVLWLLGIAWAVTTLLAWFSILFTRTHPESLYRFGVGVLRWSTRVEAYALLLHDEYPPFSMD